MRQLPANLELTNGGELIVRRDYTRDGVVIEGVPYIELEESTYLNAETADKLWDLLETGKRIRCERDAVLVKVRFSEPHTWQVCPKPEMIEVTLNYEGPQ